MPVEPTKSTFISTYIANYYAARSSTGPTAHAGISPGHRTPTSIRAVWDEAERLWAEYVAEADRREVAGAVGYGSYANGRGNGVAHNGQPINGLTNGHAALSPTE